MDTSYNKDKDEDKVMNLYSKTSTPYPPNNGRLIDSGYETDTTGKFLEYYYEAKIDHNHPNFHMIQKNS